MVEYCDQIKGLFEYNTDQGGNLLHLAVQFSHLCLREVLPFVVEQINGIDINGKMTDLLFFCCSSFLDLEYRIDFTCVLTN